MSKAEKWYSKHQEIQNLLESLSEEARNIFASMYEDVAHLEVDLEYLNAIIDGSWPDADKIIQRRRNKQS